MHPSPVDLDAIARRAGPEPVQVPPENEEEEFTAPLVARPPVIPLRSSTPVTSLKLEEPSRSYFHHGDGLGLVRGSLAHGAIEEWFKTGQRPRLEELMRSVDENLGERAVRGVVAEVDGMLDIFDASQLADTLRDGDTRSWFELPFSWDWDGVPVHGTIDLAYETGGAWHVLDFKTDDLRGRSLADASQAYLPQLALYASALERAVGRSPVPGLLFLRTGDLYVPPPAGSGKSPGNHSRPDRQRGSARYTAVHVRGCPGTRSRRVTEAGTCREVFDGGHRINGEATFRFPHRHQSWPEPSPAADFGGRLG